MMRRIFAKKTARMAGGEGKTLMGKCLAGKTGLLACGGSARTSPGPDRANIDVREGVVLADAAHSKIQRQLAHGTGSHAPAADVCSLPDKVSRVEDGAFGMGVVISRPIPAQDVNRRLEPRQVVRIDLNCVQQMKQTRLDEGHLGFMRVAEDVAKPEIVVPVQLAVDPVRDPETVAAFWSTKPQCSAPHRRL